ncbi:putative F-box domain-containing protein [Rosa chinensis]|uniref:Putative F-box domain-containing protein n=1 Tax=Rosa chinensis TaxID=74649 RepID=A0A2P6QKJ8_ROSCH|nr:F-box/kelch-repeat protein At3g06240 [Rosa chinensis]XP_024158923.1 F-box/kelch-repeat protein At3g06240 [Rosa chinensis]XP_040375722.1 F-box/kelch-repeat protein At3g06240 [Rosa chinensis]PRQ34701.1 putative F-box domain-containing protein [Rosa chinensis]
MADQKKQMRLPNLPTEVIREILGWLPVKSLCRFRCVSNTWLSLISESHFVNSHFNKAFEHEHVFYQRRRVLIRDAWLCRLFSINLDECLNHTNIDDVGDDVLVVPTQLKRRRFTKFVFSCNGLLLLKSYYVFYLLNPATKETKIVPNPPELYMWSNELYGFGFDLSSLDYKVVQGEFFEFDLGFSVYSLKTGSWRAIEKRYPYESLQSGMQGRLLNGSIHWLVCRNYNDVPSMVLLSFVLADEEVQEIPLPPDFLVDFNIEDETYFLDVFQECLCVGKNDAFEFWVMKEYGAMKSWTKISISFPCTEGLHSGFMKKNHHLLLDLHQHRLVMYNFDDGSSRNLSVGKSSNVDFVGCYLESLVSPNHYHMTVGEH